MRNAQRSKSAAAKAATLLCRIRETQSNENIQDLVKANIISDLEDRCLVQLRSIKEDVCVELTGKKPSEVAFADVDELVREDIDRFINKMEWLSSTVSEEEQRLIDISKEEKERSRKKAQELYAEDPRRAMRWYVEQSMTPACPIPTQQFTEELSRRWSANNTFCPRDDTVWKPHSIPDDAASAMEEQMRDESLFEMIIESRPKQSANGPDGIGYAVLQMGKKASAKMMTLISEAMIRHRRFPTKWNQNRTILLFKHGDPNETANWRPLTISNCMYRVWSCALSIITQRINSEHQFLSRSQKGFIRGVDGCLEHTVMANEAIAEANRSKSNLYIATIDLKDAYGSLPHEYIRTVLTQSNIPKSIKDIIMESYSFTTTKLFLHSDISDPIPVHRGVKQGCPFSPILFNMCLNPLIEALEQSGLGFKIGRSTLTVQAYADDIIIFAPSRENMQSLLRTVEEFTTYSKLEVNTAKCHTVSYTIQDNHRASDEHEFVLNGQPITSHNLSDWTEYLGTPIATTLNIRQRGTEETIANTESLIRNIFASPLKVNQMIDAVRRFAIPGLDYTLTEGSPRLTDLRKLDTLIRTEIAKHVKTTGIPVEYFTTNWKNGGLSLQPLHKRAQTLKIKSFVSMLNSPNTTTKTMFRACVEEERKHRNIMTCTVEESNFLNWDLTTRDGRHGTSALCGRALKAAEKLGVKIKLDESSCAYVEDNGAILNTPKQISSGIMKRIAKTSYENLKSLQLHGHSFLNTENNKNSNSLVGNYSHTISDKIVSFQIAARTNTLITGNILARRRDYSEVNDPGCPYCHVKGAADTLSHRLNGCTASRGQQIVRHDMVVKEIITTVRKRMPSALISVGRSVRVQHRNLSITVDGHVLKPDIVVERDNRIDIIEVTVPYDGKTTSGDQRISILEERYRSKLSKYEGLVRHTASLSHKRTTLTAVVVSSLGVLYQRSMQKLQKVLGCNNKEMNTLERRISIAATIGSYIIYNKLNTRNPLTLDEDATGDPQAEEPDQ